MWGRQLKKVRCLGMRRHGAALDFGDMSPILKLHHRVVPAGAHVVASEAHHEVMQHSKINEVHLKIK